MATKKASKPKPKTRRRTQSERFKEAARDLADAGELNLTDARKKFEDAIETILPSKKSR